MVHEGTVAFLSHSMPDEAVRCFADWNCTTMMQMNPKGLVPVLRHRDTVVVESDDINKVRAQQSVHGDVTVFCQGSSQILAWIVN